MRAAKLTAAGSVEIDAATEPLPLGVGEVRIDVTYCGICGSDLHMLHYAEHLVGHVLGHEFTGVVSEVGDDVAEEWKTGDRVVVRPMTECGECTSCLTGIGVCAPGLMIGPGLGRPGGLAESVTVPSEMLFRVPDGMSDEAAAVAEPLAVAVRGVERSTARTGDGVCVLGGGPIGFMTVIILRARGIQNVVVVEPNEARAEKVSELDVPTCSPDEAAEAVLKHLGGAPRVVIDCTGHPSGGSLGVSLLPQNGHLAVVGVTSSPVTADFSSVTTKELTITGSLAYSRENFTEALEHLASGRIPVDKIVTSVLPLAEADEIIHRLASGEASDIKVLLRP
jgi:(R,R)-butanediol dehydrogenase/meso-butanediol dehydrogenase/diacetyl reductase